MISKFLRLAGCMLLLSLGGCANINSLLSPPTPAPVVHATATLTPSPSATQTIAPSGDQAHHLRIWLPKLFDPNSGTVPADLLKQRLADFQQSHSGLTVDVRIKDEEGENSLLNTLTITSVAAPSALPDLIALSRADLEAAALKGLLHPIDGLSTMLHDPNWYNYARDLGHVGNIGYGLPFAGNMLVLVHLPENKLDAWESLLAEKQPVIFAAGDPQALFVLSLYASAGGTFVDEQGQPVLQEAPLTRIFTLIHDGLSATTFSPSLLAFETDDQALQAYRGGLAKGVVTWSASRAAADGDAQLIPPISEPYTFADAWIWALAGATPENQQAATELAEYLMADPFLDQWTEANGYYPTRLKQDSPQNAILDSANALPSGEVTAVLGPILKQALDRILKGEQVEAVVSSVLEAVK